jgi:hypothetical protein
MTDFKQDAPMDVYPIRITAAHARKARKAGKGNLSRGIRQAIEKMEAEEQVKPAFNGIDRRKLK